MKIEQLVVGQLASNCYLVWDEKSKEAVIIDPADAADFIIRKIQDFELKPKLIIATHGHFDHLLAVTELKLAFKIPFYLHQKDVFLAKKMRDSFKFWLGREANNPNPKPDQFIEEGDLIKFGKEALKVIETPGHSPGGISLYSQKKKVLFSGDTLFKQGVGRTDFSYGSEKDLIKSLKNLLQLPPQTKVYPGHGEETTIKEEKGNFNFS